MSNAGSWRRRLVGLAIATSLLTACATVGSDARHGLCPPVVEYSRAEQARVAEEVAALPEGAVIVGWLADYTVLRDQARACSDETRQVHQTGTHGCRYQRLSHSGELSLWASGITPDDWALTARSRFSQPAGY